jgi:hypothetical protein
MPTIKQYRPAFCDGFEDVVVEFSTTEELINIPFVKRFCTGDFCGFLVSDECLLAMYKHGEEWYVVGILSDPDLVELPRWERKQKKQHVE